MNFTPIRFLISGGRTSADFVKRLFLLVDARFIHVFLAVKKELPPEGGRFMILVVNRFS